MTKDRPARMPAKINDGRLFGESHASGLVSERGRGGAECSPGPVRAGGRPGVHQDCQVDVARPTKDDGRSTGRNGRAGKDGRIKGPRPAVWLGDAWAIPLGRDGKHAIVDAGDLGRVDRLRWYLFKKKNRVTEYAYAYTGRVNGKNQLVRMHRVISRAAPSQLVDHIDFDGLNNRRSNLRLCTVAENARHSKSRGGASAFKGVTKYQGGRWVGYITANSKQIYLGIFDSELDAAKAYDAKAKELHGEFAYLNFPEQREARAVAL